MAPHNAADLRRIRAFSNLFIQTEIIRKHHAILCARRPRADGENARPWHAASV